MHSPRDSQTSPGTLPGTCQKLTPNLRHAFPRQRAGAHSRRDGHRASSSPQHDACALPPRLPAISSATLFHHLFQYQKGTRRSQPKCLSLSGTLPGTSPSGDHKTSCLVRARSSLPTGNQLRHAFPPWWWPPDGSIWPPDKAVYRSYSSSSAARPGVAQSKLLPSTPCTLPPRLPAISSSATLFHHPIIQFDTKKGRAVASQNA